MVLCRALLRPRERLMAPLWMSWGLYCLSWTGTVWLWWTEELWLCGWRRWEVSAFLNRLWEILVPCSLRKTCLGKGPHLLEKMTTCRFWVNDISRDSFHSLFFLWSGVWAIHKIWTEALKICLLLGKKTHKRRHFYDICVACMIQIFWQIAKLKEEAACCGYNAFLKTNIDLKAESWAWLF